ncbi:MAG: cAMP/cGMP-dependent 3',5'-cyclic-AMP/GMP phosphodiesterase [Spirochaetia bacterium]|nr:cAMP/cGMP-dependent 3',5'-cyclic-AMP/GMP phosphodiesterase [Spirochaetia bacterium]
MPKIELTEPYTTLPRGGYILETSAGYMQIGSPPETIKDSMFLPRSTPQIFVLPNKFFHVAKGISVAEIEFPLYYNHFLRQKKTYVVCTAEQRDQLKTVLREAVFGPDVVDLRSEYVDGENTFGFPDMKAEMDYFRGNRTLDDLVKFVVFRDDKVRINQVTIEKKPDGNFAILDQAWGRNTDLPGEVGFNVIYESGERLPEPYKPPLLGITCLGPSHGFDPDDNTSGFLLWINHQGIMVDPPVNSTEWLQRSNVNPKDISSILLTHCHADHDAGTFQKVLEEGKITVYSSETVMYSFIRKYSALTRIPAKELFTLFDFVPVIIGKTYMINGAEFRFSYALHSIPSLSFEFVFQDQSFVYSSDHLNDPDKFKEMREKGILPETRYLDLLDFPFHHKIIYHEAGIPPLHTRVDHLRTLPSEVQKKITVYHIARKDMPPGTEMTLARFGIEHTLYPPITPPQHEEAYRLLDVLSNIDIFRDFPISKAKEFITIVEQETFKRGDYIIRKNTPGDKFFIVLSGNVKVEGMDQEGEDANDVLKRYGSYEYFGEASLILDQPRSADVIAETETMALTVEKSKFLNFIRGSELVKDFARLSEIRKTGTWELLTNSRFFRGITSAQKTQLELILELQKFRSGDYLIRQKELFQTAFIIRQGKVEVFNGQGLVETLGRGDFCGEIFQLQKESPSSFDFRASGDLEAYGIPRGKLMKYIANNPGVYMRLNYVYGK